MENKGLRLKRNETFAIREGWIEKGLINIKNNDKCFSKQYGTQTLGIGSNMVKSLRYWLTACGAVEFQTSAALITEFGYALLEHDMYLDDIFSWWLIHYKLVSNFSDCPVFNTFFNLNITKFEKETVLNTIKSRLEENYTIGSEASLESDLTVLLKTYIDSEVSDPENNFNCPLGKLGLIKSLDKKTYMKTNPKYHTLDYRIIYISIYDYCKENKVKNFNLEDFIQTKNNPIKLFNLTKSSLFMNLDEMQKNGLIRIIKTAGLNTVHLEKELNIKELIEDYFKTK